MGREPLLPLLKKFHREKAPKILLKLLDDQMVGPLWTISELGYCGDLACIPRLEKFLEGGQAAWRKRARRAIEKIRTRVAAQPNFDCLQPQNRPFLEVQPSP